MYKQLIAALTTKYFFFMVAHRSNALMQGHYNQNGCFGYVSENLVSNQKFFHKLTAISQALHRINSKSFFKKLAILCKVKVTS